ncbi:hypothetical protein [Aquabacterium sp. J223]|uniref:hypothetical protein n=1 Tax=Aquabacterium sp. J223 TaxID=2898431 RepID=UPI0021AE2364|nr:hypothetical protein [Aquabacterium sp. J223]UUX96547.1 hypothetical protein LRS07_04380 [Aquabacterium sp. J223]
MLFALMALAILALGSVALVRSVDTTTLLLGNLGFKQDATTASAAAAEQAIDWLRANASALNTSSTGSGYSASALAQLDVTGATRDATRAIVNWDGSCLGRSASEYSACITPFGPFNPAGDTNYRSHYLITRLCSADGPPSGTDATGAPVVCSRPAAVSTSAAIGRGAIDASMPEPVGNPTPASPYYRILVRTQGGRGTVSFTETLVRF